MISKKTFRSIVGSVVTEMLEDKNLDIIFQNGQEYLDGEIRILSARLKDGLPKRIIYGNIIKSALLGLYIETGRNI